MTLATLPSRPLATSACSQRVCSLPRSVAAKARRSVAYKVHATVGSSGAAESTATTNGAGKSATQPPAAPAASDTPAAAEPPPSPAPAEATADPASPPGPSSHPVDDMFAASELIEELKEPSTWSSTSGLPYFAAQAAIAALILFPPFQLKGLVDLAGTLLITAGLVFISYGVWSLRSSLSPLPAPRRNNKLVTSGMYSYVRHPMYAGLLMGGLGLAIVSRNECRLALTALLWFVLDRKAAFEERALTERYGEAYTSYTKKVARFVPYLF